MASTELAGRTVVSLEARRAQEMADLIRRYGGEPWSVPCMQELPPDDTSESVGRLRQLCSDGADLIVCLTGVGTRRMFELASQLELEARLREVFDQAIVAVRGPKPAAVLRELGIRIDRQAPEPNTTRDVLAALADDSFRAAAVQLYGGPDVELREGLEARGATVLELPLYKWALPEDLGPMRALFEGLDRVDALCVTSATQIHNLFSVASQDGRDAALRAGLGHAVIAAVGPVAAGAVRDHGLRVDIEPEHPHMGTMVRDLARHFASLPSGS